MGDAADDAWSAEVDRKQERDAFLAGVERLCLETRASCDAHLEPDDDGLLTCRECGKQFDYP